MTRKRTTLIQVLFCIALLGFTYAAYYPGLSGGFLFDDLENLYPLEYVRSVADLEAVRAFLFSGISGPTGRPVSLLSFLLNLGDWPGNPGAFKQVNLFIHLLVGALIGGVTYKLLCLAGRKHSRACWLALASAGIWLLHPYFVSTTLYAIQRMAQLSTLFVAAGLLGYLHGRSLLQHRPYTGHALMTIAVVLGTLLATFSKENGVLLPLLILVIEFSVGHLMRTPSPDWRWKALLIWLPSAGLVGYLITQLNFSEVVWPERPFNQVERLLSETRVLWEYLYQLAIPRIEGRGVFQDGYPISTGLLAPPSTLLALAGIAMLLISGFSLRKRYPFFSLAVLFYLAGHLIESSVIGLELYFEHRNYLPSMFLFLPLAIGFERLGERYRFRLSIAAYCVLATFLAWSTFQRASLWANTESLQLYWALNAPASPRAQNAIAKYLHDTGRTPEAVLHLENSVARLPDSAFLTVRHLVMKTYAGQARAIDFASAASRIRQQPTDLLAIRGLDALVTVAISPPVQSTHLAGARLVLDTISKDPRYAGFGLIPSRFPYLYAQLDAVSGRPAEALKQFQIAMRIQNDTEAALAMVEKMASQGYYQESLILLEQAERVFLQQNPRSLRRSASVYRAAINEFRTDLMRLSDERKSQEESKGQVLR
jgi:tetratricopeptide (TPR) repeat protein